MVKQLLSLAFVVFLASCGTGFGSGAGGAGGAENAHIVPGTQSDLEANVGDRIFFDFDRSNVREDAKETLARQAAWLQQYPNVHATVEGHADERGTREYNLALGERRAEAAKKYLISLGVDAKRLSTISYGKERLAVVGNTEEAHAQNRRAVSVVVSH
ncbi:MAG: peptidoglycan-associated lipoprotein Pal [Alphaproteobacteria bacterium]|nr:peptidoglycan-associated lipoprotein Pal [Alphaproteobacteria bacterium]OJV12006.1 MAG: peptidoglycan-associated lipoprotein [Alphaproteobacteria bacterium 33-17]